MTIDPSRRRHILAALIDAYCPMTVIDGKTFYYYGKDLIELITKADDRWRDLRGDIPPTDDRIWRCLDGRVWIKEENQHIRDLIIRALRCIITTSPDDDKEPVLTGNYSFQHGFYQDAVSGDPVKRAYVIIDFMQPKHMREIADHKEYRERQAKAAPQVTDEMVAAAYATLPEHITEVVGSVYLYQAISAALRCREGK